MTLKPLGDRVIVEPLERDQMTPGGLYLPETAKEKPQEGTVIAVGPGQWDKDGEHRTTPDVKAGDRVLFTRYAGTEFQQREGADQKKYLILSERDILAVFTN